MLAPSIVTYKHPTIHKQMQCLLLISTIPIKVIGLKMLIFSQFLTWIVDDNQTKWAQLQVLLCFSNPWHVISAWLCNLKGTTPSNLKVMLNNQRIQVVCWLYVDHLIALSKFQCCVRCSRLWFMSWLNGNLRNTKVYPLNSKLVA